VAWDNPAEVEFRILGPLEVVADGRDVTPVRHKQRALLALLLLRANHVVASGELLEGLWGEIQPGSAPTALHGHVSALRKLLGSEAIETRAPGYLLRLSPGQLDLERFDGLVAEARADDDPDRKAELLRSALALFRGEPLSDLRYEDFAREEAARITERRLSALEECFEAELALGRHGALIAELQALVAHDPLRERLRGQLMLALYRAGRQASALQVYQDGRHTLAEELGIDPGPSLQELERRILTQDPRLGLVERARSTARSASQPHPPRSRVLRLARRHPVATTVVIIALVATTIPATIMLRGAGLAQPIAGDAIGLIDLQRGAQVGSILLGSRPGALASGDTGVWVTLPDRGAVVQIDPRTRAVVDTVRVGADPTGIAVGAGSVWVSNNGSATISRISPVTNEVVQTIDVPAGPAGIVVGPDGVWVANSVNDSVSRIDPVDGKVNATIAVGDRPVDLAMSETGLWVANSGSGDVARVDTRLGLATETVDVGNGPQAVVAESDAVWVANRLDGTVARIDPQRNVLVGTTLVGGTPTNLAVGGGFVWVSDQSRGTVTRIEPRSGAMTTIILGSQAGSLAIEGTSLWVSVRGPEASHRGGTLTVLSRNGLDTIDPALAYFSDSWSILALTNDGLVGFRRVGGSDGAALVPALALSIPTSADGGRTYTFKLRPGIRYSNDVPVRPADFRRALERVFRLQSDGSFHYAAIEGAKACGQQPATCDLSRGIVTDDAANTVTFHLVEPDPDFLYRLALPFAFAVPAETPNTVDDRSPIPATGPYAIERYAKDDELVLGRNPAFAERSAESRPRGFPDRIVWRLSLEDRLQVDDVLGGRADLMFRELPPDLLGNLTTSHAGQVHFAPRTGTYFMHLNVTTPPFDDLRVRRALNFAVDRKAVVDIFGGTGSATCQVLPPNFAGYEPYCPFTLDPGVTWTAPDMRAARALVEASGTSGAAVIVWATPDYAFGVPVPVGEYFVDLLNELGYRATLHLVDRRSDYFAATLDASRHVQIAFGGWASDFPTESGFIVPVLSCDSLENGGSQFCDQAVERRMDEAMRVQLTDLASAHRMWTSIEHDITDRAPWVPLVTRSWVNLVSERAGNFQVHPVWGPLIDQMWVQ
jgi:YVTN family beta-propeller protein